MYCVDTFVRIEAEGASEHFFTAAAPINNKEEENEVGPGRCGSISWGRLGGCHRHNTPCRRCPNRWREWTCSGEYYRCRPASYSTRSMGTEQHMWQESIRCCQYPCFTLYSKGDLENPISTFWAPTIPILHGWRSPSYYQWEIVPGEVVTDGKFLQWIGLWLLMATIQGPTWRGYWSNKPLSRFNGAPCRLGNVMSRNGFEAILYSLRYTNIDRPIFRDPFHEVCQMIMSCSSIMLEVFVPSWISGLDESMSYWTNIYSCPGFMFVSKKAWPFDKEWHSICCAVGGVMYDIELVQGKNHPHQMGAKEFDNLGGTTVELLIRLTRHLGTLEKWFCWIVDFVLPKLWHNSQRRVFLAKLSERSAGTVKKDHLKESIVGQTDCLRMNLLEDNSKLDIHGFKELDYIMMLIATYGTIERVGQEQTRTWQSENTECRTTFQFLNLCTITSNIAMLARGHLNSTPEIWPFRIPFGVLYLLANKILPMQHVYDMKA